MGYHENVNKLLNIKLPCDHTIREAVQAEVTVIRYGPNDEPWILCPECGLAWPLYEYKIELKVKA